jgi:hypothetical protein
MLIECVGIGFLAAGAATLVATFIEWLHRPRGSGITAEMAELLATPTYVLLARTMARAHGYPESEWERFKHRAFAEILMRRR